MNAEQASFRYEHKKLCMERAIKRGDYDAANVFAAQAAYYWRLMKDAPMTTANRNDLPTASC